MNVEENILKATVFSTQAHLLCRWYIYNRHWKKYHNVCHRIISTRDTRRLLQGRIIIVETIERHFPNHKVQVMILVAEDK